MGDKIRLYVKSCDRKEYPAVGVQREAGRCKASAAVGEGSRELRAGNGPPVPTVIREEEVRSSQLRIQVEPRIYDSS